MRFSSSLLRLFFGAALFATTDVFVVHARGVPLRIRANDGLATCTSATKTTVIVTQTVTSGASSTTATEPYETVICKPCPTGQICPKICEPLTTTITPSATPTPALAPTPTNCFVGEPITTTRCKPCEAEVCIALCQPETIVVCPSDAAGSEVTATGALDECTCPGSALGAQCSLPAYCTDPAQQGSTTDPCIVTSTSMLSLDCRCTAGGTCSLPPGCAAATGVTIR